MSLKPNFIERLLVHAGVIPSALLDVGIGMFQASAVLTAGDIRLFNHLKDSSLTLDELHNKTRCSLHGLHVLLTCMQNIGYVKKIGGRYSLSKAVRRSFPIDFFPDIVPFFRAVNEKLNSATSAVRTDPAGGIMGWDMVKSGEVGKSYQTFMRWLGSSTVGEVVSRIKLPTPPKRMLDIGGSHGLYCVQFCRKYPTLTATVLDWAIGLENAGITLAQEKDVAQRIDLHESDLEKDNLPTGYDFVFLGNIIHGLTEEGMQILFKKIADATTKNASIAILDQYSNVKGSAFVRGVASLIGWNLFLFSGGRAYEFDMVRKYLERCGFSSAKLMHLRRSPGFSVITAHK
jgi:hypothetical protein